MSMRSIRGPASLARYDATAVAEHVQETDGSPRWPHGHGLLAATNWNRQGKAYDPSARAMRTVRSSMGWRIACSTIRLHSPSSSRNRTPLCASEISPGRTGLPPPSRPAAPIEWWGARNGLRCAATRGSPLSAMECTSAVS